MGKTFSNQEMDWARAKLRELLLRCADAIAQWEPEAAERLRAR